MNDYYDLLGIEPGADKDAIRSAYRDRLEGASQSERAKLNKAWNVLSDPVQRGRYDSDASGGSADDVVDLDDDDDAPVPARTGARPPRGGRTDRPARPRPPARAPLEPTIELPPGMEFAPKRARNLALLTDVAVLLVVFMLSLNLVPGMVDSNFTKQVDHYNALVKSFDKLDKAKGKAQDAADKAKAAAKAAEKKSGTTDVVLQAKAKQAQVAATKAEAKAKAKDAEVQRASKNIPVGPQLAAIAVVLAVSLLYAVPSSAKTGQTLGKRLQKIRLVRIDGSPAGWWPSFVHFLVPLLIAFGLFGQLQGLAAILGLGAVLWNLRDRNRQGLHDKLAKTLVVANSV